ncbi:MAG: deoxyribonuclease IV [Candidatus Brocadiaceae bacterium]|nr:deoxyribonuclease IV [Candidatus Brocadiaceae bacterium]
MLLGLHCSIGGGFSNAFREAEALGVDTFQIFTKNQRQWKEKIIHKEESIKFLDYFNTSNVKVVFSHASYLINLASNDHIIRKSSIHALTKEVLRCHDLHFPFTILHPGAGKELSKQESIKNVATALKMVFHATGNIRVKILLENTAGQGSSIGSRFEQIRQIMHEVGSPRLGICFDTCHAFAAGYDIRTKTGLESTIDDLDRIVGLKNLCAIHLNDSKGELGSHLDRHEHIGRGKLGIVPFQQIMNSFQHIPKIIETKKEGKMDAVNLSILRGLIE